MVMQQLEIASLEDKSLNNNPWNFKKPHYPWFSHESVSTQWEQENE